MGWSFDESLPIYLQVIERIKVSIANGSFQKEEKLPSVRELALTAGVNPNTIQKAYAQLESEHYVVTQRTSGRFVTNDEEVLKKLRKDMAKTYLDEFYTNLKKLGFTNQEIQESLEEWIQKEGM